MPQLIIGMIIKNYLPKILGLLALMFIGIFSSIWFLDGWPAFFSSIGVILLCLIAIPVIIITGLVKTFKLGKDVKNFLLRKSSKGELMTAIIQGVGTYMMGEQMSKMFSMMAQSPNENSKNKLANNIDDVEIKSLSNTTATAATLGVASSLVVNDTLSQSSLDTNIPSASSDINDDFENLENNVDLNAMMELMNSPEIQQQMAEMMKMFAAGEDSEVMIDAVSLFQQDSSQITENDNPLPTSSNKVLTDINSKNTNS